MTRTTRLADVEEVRARIQKARQPYKAPKPDRPSCAFVVGKDGVAVAVMSDAEPTPEHRAKHELVDDVVYEKVPGKTKEERRTVKRVKSDLEQMRDKGQITADQCAEGLKFRNEFEIAQLDPMKAADPGRQPSGQRKDFGVRVYEARDYVADKIKAVGGFSAPSGQALWWAVGAGESHRQTAWRIGSWVTERHVAGLVIAALCVLTPPKGK